MTEIKLKTITLHNFRPFYGHQTIDLSTNHDKPLVLIKALNDVGKTSMFKALQFCLFGSGSSRNVVSNINRTAAENGEGQTCVTLSFYHENKHYQITRRITFSRTSDGMMTTGKEHLDVLVDGYPETLGSISEQRQYIEAILPEDASQFFFFDGEDIQKYTLQPLGEKVREAIEMVLGIRELLNARDDVETVTRQISGEMDQLNTKRSKHIEEAKAVEKLGQKVEGIRAKIEEIEGKISQAQQTINDCDGNLRRNKAISQKIFERNAAEKLRDEVKDQIESNMALERDFNQHLGVVLVSPTFMKLSEMGRTEVPHWKRVAIATITSGYYENCICGREITPEIRERFENLLDKEIEVSPLRYMSEQVEELLRIVSPNQLEDEFYDLIEKRRNFESKLKSTQEKIKELNDVIAGRDDLGETLRLVEQTRNRADKELNELKEEKTKHEALLELSEKEYKKRQRKLSLEQSDSDVEKKQNLLERCNRCKNAIEEAIAELVDNSRSKVQELASNVFLQLTNAPDLYKGIEITEDYELMIKTVGGTTRPVWKQDPSSGQSQVIATSFIAALNHYTAREAPIIIDTPIGRLDTIHKERIINFYPKIGPQVVIFYQPNELDNEDIAPIEKYISSEWVLERDSKNPDTTLIKKTD